VQDKDDLGKAFGTAYLAMNITAACVQLFLTTFIMKRFGIKVALMVLPIVILSVSLGYMAIPILAVGMILPSADGGFSYSLNQSAKEALYVPTTKDQKYKAKAFIDMFVQRFAKVIGMVVSLTVTLLFTDYETIRWLSIPIIFIALIWIYVARYAGSNFEKLTHSKQ